jgi:alpha-L-fucosidase 2
MKKGLILLPLITLIVFGCSETQESKNNETLWYTSPARYWNSEALHLGNGYMGVSFYGRIEEEVLELSEKSMWTGGPFRGDWEESGVNPECRESIPEIAELIKEGRIREADSLVKNNYL